MSWVKYQMQAYKMFKITHYREPLEKVVSIEPLFEYQAFKNINLRFKQVRLNLYVFDNEK